jgi:uncharacterized protein YdbL (DUF1318 family)
MDDLSIESSFTSPVEPQPYAVQVKVSMILMGIVGVIAVLPFFGFAAWIIAGPMMLVSFIMIIIVFSKGGVKPGLLLLGCQIIVMPVVVIAGPVISSALGLSGAVGAVAVAASAVNSSGDRVPAAIPYPQAASPATAPAIPVSTTAAAVQLPPELLKLKEQVQTQQMVLQKLKNTGMTKEVASGFLVPDEKAAISARKLVLQENLWREQVFKQIAVLTQQSPEQVAAEFARLAAVAANR